MNDEELKKLWQQQPLREPPFSPEQLVSAMHKQTTQLRRVLDVRDLRELLACAVVIIIFGIFYFTVYRTPISRLGVLIVIGGAVFVAWKIVHTRWTTPPAAVGATVVESLRAELNSVRAQSRLLGSALWWYILPGFLGVTIATWGLQIDLYTKIFCTIIFVAVDAWVYWLNQRAVTNQLHPVEAQLQSLIRSAETGEPPDETHLANLRPIVLSMAAADRVKPVEFKLAFWQIAIFGLPGIVGIWFFLMLGLTMEKSDWKANVSIPETFSPSLRPEENSRYSLVARHVVDLINARDHAALQSLFNPSMSKALPPTKASEFFTRFATNSGRIENFHGPVPNDNRGWIAFRLHCQRGEWTMSLALDAGDKISGIYFSPAPRPPVTAKAFLMQLFSWQHLLWLPPFFLAGLLYSWLIQKLTRRAVGISPLGIHLCKGQSLVLWDDITEVRPFRFLHIRNLWLIKQSGEKTLMHWTPLERHSDLKTAVESFAPPNHSLRQYLSLLKP